jgi:hypothetical protein
VRGQKPEGGQRVPVGEATVAAFVDRDRDVFGASEVVETQLVGGMRDSGQVGDGGGALP